MNLKKGRGAFSTSGFQHSGLKSKESRKRLPAGAVRVIEQVVRDSKLQKASRKTGQSGNQGVPVLFAGSSGTGKTMAAEILAGELSMEIYKVDLAGLVSKYIGETEKNLASLFEKAARNHWVLYFDEADALFGKRSEVKDSHDRYANMEVSHLLQAMEAFDGIAVLAVNNKAVIDPEYLQHFHYVVDV